MTPQSWLVVDADGWSRMAEDQAKHGGRLLSLWASRDATGAAVVRAAYIGDAGVQVVSLFMAAQRDGYPGIEPWFPCAGRMQRAAADLSGLRSSDPDTRPWLRHAAWPADFFPLALNPAPPSPATPVIDSYAFVPVSGDGVHEIAVGPVHAGIIEPGHFRFSVVGEKVLRLEEHLGYVHKGIERRFTEIALLDGHRLAGRVSGDSTVAYSWAYCQALEDLSGTRPPPRANCLRALALELERLANHCGDIGAIGNDAGFAFGLAQFSRMKEQLLRATAQALGRRYLMDFVVPGGTCADLAPAGLRAACWKAENRRAGSVGTAPAPMPDGSLPPGWRQQGRDSRSRSDDRPDDSRAWPGPRECAANGRCSSDCSGNTSECSSGRRSR